MMEIQHYHDRHYWAACKRHPESDYVGSAKQVALRRRQHNEKYHPRKWRRHLRREEILRELQGPLHEMIAIEDPGVSAEPTMAFRPGEMTRERARRAIEAGEVA